MAAQRCRAHWGNLRSGENEADLLDQVDRAQVHGVRVGADLDDEQGVSPMGPKLQGHATFAGLFHKSAVLRIRDGGLVEGGSSDYECRGGREDG